MILNLPCGRKYVIDECDLDLVSHYRWSSDVRSNTVYVRGYDKNNRKNRPYLHKLITSNDRTDHIDGNGLNNIRKNLRPSSQAQNCCNSSKKRPHKTYKGVYFDKRRGVWWSQLYYNGKSYYGGAYNSEIEASIAYDVLAIKHHKEFARTNTGLK